MLEKAILAPAVRTEVKPPQKAAAQAAVIATPRLLPITGKSMIAVAKMGASIATVFDIA